MNCEHVQRVLDALIDNELDLWSALRVRRHLARCADCAAIHHDARRLSEQARSWRDVAAPTALRSRIRSTLVQAPTLPQTPSVSARRGLGSNLRLLSGGSLMRRSLAFALAASITLGLFLVLGRRADPVYAQLQRTAAAYRQVRSVHIQAWFLDVRGRRMDFEAWYAKPYLSWRRAGNELSINDGTGKWTYIEGDRTASYQPVSGLKAEDWQRHFDVEKHLHHARRGFGVEDLGTEVIHGIPLHKIRLSGEGRSERETWWLDPSTHLVRQRRTERSDGPLSQNWRVVGQSTLIEYNVTPPRGLFTFTPPRGAQVVRMEPGPGGHFEKLLWDSRVLAQRKARGIDFQIELLAFHRSPRGDLFVVLRPNWWGSLGLVLTDTDGGRYVGRGFHLGDQREKGYTTIFFPERSLPIRRGLEYQLRVYQGDGIDDDPWTEGESSRPLAVFDQLTPRDGPASLDTLAEEFARRDMDVTLGFLRSSGLGLAALRQGHAEEAQAYLEDAVNQATNPNRDDTHAVYLGLAGVYGENGRVDEARAMLRKAYHTATRDVPDVRTAMRAAEAMERLGDRESARHWVEELLVSREFRLAPGQVMKLVSKYEQLSGDSAGAKQYLVKGLEPWLREQPVLGFGDAWNMGQALEQAGLKDLALEAYVKGLETTILKPYRESGGKLFRDDAEKLIRAVRRLGGQEAVERLTVRQTPER